MADLSVCPFIGSPLFDIFLINLARSRTPCGFGLVFRDIPGNLPGTAQDSISIMAEQG